MANVKENGNYFKEIGQQHELKLLQLVQVSENFLNDCHSLPDDYRGMITSAVGKTKLLVNEKIKQFYGLCLTNMNPKENEMAINEDDLAGFWDLIMIEVRLLYKNFKFIADCAKENWKMPMQDVQVVEEKKMPSKTIPRKSFPAVKSILREELKKTRSRQPKKQSTDDVQVIWQSSENKIK